MLALGIISLVIAGLCFLTGMGQDIVFQQYAYFLIGLVLDVAGMGFLILDRLNILIKKISEKSSNNSPKVSSTEKLLQLNNLYKQGLLTAEEFASKKEGLLQDITNKENKK